ncbi:polysaccharide biosynthesis protein GumE [Cellvibrio sp. OA-2007]|uniref:polysaccharide biosynthesis protein GumE n=1 Tax=Cellvibrio sp. OA-2007 TaxID=529823 RepID=UPI000B1EB06A|nr:polysaccharide biosynthesis protein GumE [Cellvibrio sp. OA-2007]
MNSSSSNRYLDRPIASAPWQPAIARPWLSDQQWVSLIIVASVSYQALLCFINSVLMPVSRPLLGMAEAVIMLMCLPLLARRLLPGVLWLGAMAAAMLCLVWLINQQVTIKSFRDLAIPLCFFWLGCNIGQLALADRALKLAIWVILAMGLFELWFLDYYTQWFDIFNYYVNVGALNPSADFFMRDDRLLGNGMRPEGIGRTLLPQLLGPHRVSSVFLEPIALGNFATLCAAWGLCRPQQEWRSGVFFVLAAIVMMVLCDSRFALMTVSALILLRLLVRGALLNLCVLAPFAAIAALLCIGLLIPSEMGEMMVSDDLRGRLSYSGWSLLEFDLPQLFGIGHSDSYFDEGYAHSIASFGLPLILLLWCSFWLLPFTTERGQRFRAMVSIYIALILCISGTSFFALKTAGLLWFLVGCSLQNPAAINRAGTRLPLNRSNRYGE